MSPTSDLARFFDERMFEISEYLDLLSAVEQEAAGGTPRLERSRAPITPSQQKVLFSSVYLQLYNLTEAIVTRCLDALSEEFKKGAWQPGDLEGKLRQEWVRYVARTHVDMTPENRLHQAMKLCDHLIGSLPLGEFRVDAGGGGNWDDEAIYKLSERVGCSFKVAKETAEAVKRPIRDEMGALRLVKDRRNSLAHGSISFVDCADGVSVSELKQVTRGAELYLREFIASFSTFIDLNMFVVPGRRPVSQTS